MIKRNLKIIGPACLSLVVFSILACGLFSGRSVATEPSSTSTVAVTATEPSALLPPTATVPPATPSSLPPSPTPQPTPDDPATPAEAEREADDLSLYHQAMRPEFAGDVETVAAAGASRYKIEVNVEFPTEADSALPNARVYLRGVESVRYTNTEAVSLSEIYFRLYPNLPGYGGRMTVNDMTVDGQAVTSELEADDSAMRVPLAQPLAPGEVIELSLTFEAEVPTQGAGYNIFSYTEQTLALADFYPAVAVYDDEGWNIEVPPTYGDATFLDTSLYRVELTVPESMIVAASGSLSTEQVNDNGTRTLVLVSGPMRDFYIVMRADFEAASDVVDGILVTSYYPPDLQSGGVLALQYAVDSLRVFNEQFGPYPYTEFDVVATPTQAGGVEYPGIVVVAQFLYDQTGGFFEHATAHEVAHQWWYSMVGNDQIDDPWLDESLTNYSSIVYWEKIEGKDAAEQMIRRLFLEPYERAKAQGKDRAVAGPVADFSEEEYGVFVYGKGPLFFNALRQQVGDEIFFKIMQSYYAQYKYKIAYPDDLLATIERVSGQDIDPLFKMWIQGPTP